MGVITFNGVSSKTLGIEVVRPPHFQYSERHYSSIEIPGSNGNYYINHGGYKNVDGEYELNFLVDISEYSNFQSHAAAISRWLHSGRGYCKLEDSYNPDWYRMATYHESNTIENILDGGGKFTVHFDCKPQKWLKSGETLSPIASGATITNPTGNIAEPIIYLTSTGDGSFTIGDYTIEVKKSDSSVTPVIADVAMYGNNEFIYDGSMWHSYTEPTKPNEYTAVAGDVVSYNGDKFTFDGTVWHTFTSYDNARYIGATYTTITDESESNPIGLNNRYLGESTTAISAGSSVNAIVIVNYSAETGDLVIYNGNKFVFDGSKWVAEANYSGEKKFIGQTSTTISANSTVQRIGLDGMFIDFESGNAYLDSGAMKRNKLISCPEFPVLMPGDNVVTYTNLTNVQLMPRWYMI